MIVRVRVRVRVKVGMRDIGYVGKMGLILDVKQLIEDRIVENERIEFKKGWNPETVMHTICSFSNDVENQGGGYIILGIEEENGYPGNIVGVEPTMVDRINGEILNICNQIIPRPLVTTDYSDYEGKGLLVIKVPGGGERPYKCPVSLSEKRGEKAFYIRKMGRTIRANPSEERELYELGGNIPFDDRVCVNASMKDLEYALMSDFIRKINSKLLDSVNNPEELAEDLHVIRGPKEERLPVNVGLMFFNDHPEDHFREAFINIVFKPDPTGHGMIEHVVRGPLDRQLKDAVGIISNNYISEFVTKMPDRPEAVRVYNYPLEAVEEAICNAIFHKAYDIAEPITITITPDRMEITSIPGPDRSIRREDLERGVLISKRNRNRRIGNFLKELKLAESHNTGVPLMNRSMEDNGSDRPIFMTDDDRSYMTVILPVNPYFLKGDTGGNVGPTVKDNARRSTVEITSTVIDLLEENGDMSIREISEAMGYRNPPSSLRNVIRELMRIGHVKYMYPDSPNAPNQRLMLK